MVDTRMQSAPERDYTGVPEITRPRARSRRAKGPERAPPEEDFPCQACLRTLRGDKTVVCVHQEGRKLCGRCHQLKRKCVPVSIKGRFDSENGLIRMFVDSQGAPTRCCSSGSARRQRGEWGGRCYHRPFGYGDACATSSLCPPDFCVAG
jgi:hypothetical protein